MSFIGKLRELSAQQAERDADPWRSKLEAWLRGIPEISTAAALDLLGLANTSSNARQLAHTMRAIGFIPIKSKRLVPGGRCGNVVTRGWSRPFRKMKSSRPRPVAQGEKVSGERIER
jgi:hypothetical protein